MELLCLEVFLNRMQLCLQVHLLNKLIPMVAPLKIQTISRMMISCSNKELDCQLQNPISEVLLINKWVQEQTNNNCINNTNRSLKSQTKRRLIIWILKHICLRLMNYSLLHLHKLKKSIIIQITIMTITLELSQPL